MSVTWQHYENWLGVTFNHPEAAVPSPANIQRDSRAINPGDIYVALKGDRFDGHQFIDQVMEKGASAFIFDVTKQSFFNPRWLQYGIPVEDTLLAYQRIAQGWLQLVRPKVVVGITGSVGKTTCKQLTARALSATHSTFASLENYNNEIGVPASICQVTPEHSAAVFELGARHRGDIALLTELVNPDICVLLNTKKVHTSEFGSYEEIVKTKAEIFSSAKAEAVYVAPDNQPEILEIAKEVQRDNKIILFGSHNGSQSQVIRSEYIDQNFEFEISCSDQLFSFSIPYGHHSIAINTAAALAVCLAANCLTPDIVGNINGYTPQAGRFLIRKWGPKTLIDDCYNASPESMRSGFDSCKKIFKEAPIGFVLGSMYELGQDSESLHRQMGLELMTSLRPKFLWTVGIEAKAIGEGALSGGLDKSSWSHFENIDVALQARDELFAQANVLYVKASNGVGLGKLVSKLASEQS